MSARPVYHPGLGEFFKGLREKRGWTHSEAAQFADRRQLRPLSRQVILRLEVGKTKNPEPEVLRSLAALYDVPHEELLAKFWEARYGVAPEKVASVRERDQPKPTTLPGFAAVPLLKAPIAAGQPLVIEPNPERDSTLAFADWFLGRFDRPMCLHVGKREESMLPTIQPGDVVAINQAESVRSRPISGHIYAVNFGPLTGDEGGAVKRVELANDHLIINSDNPDKNRYPTLAFDVEGKNLLDILRGEVIWFGRYIGSGTKRGR